jgi:transcriptional regulator with XRE-family HTH domain
VRKHGLRAEEIHLQFCERVRNRARKRKISIEALADAAQISRSQLWRILAGQSSPSLETIAALAEALGCKPKQLVP